MNIFFKVAKIIWSRVVPDGVQEQDHHQGPEPQVGRELQHHPGGSQQSPGSEGDLNPRQHNILSVTYVTVY